MDGLPIALAAFGHRVMVITPRSSEKRAKPKKVIVVGRWEGSNKGCLVVLCELCVFDERLGIVDFVGAICKFQWLFSFPFWSKVSSLLVLPVVCLTPDLWGWGVGEPHSIFND